MVEVGLEPDQLIPEELVGQSEGGSRPINSGGVGWSAGAEVASGMCVADSVGNTRRSRIAVMELQLWTQLRAQYRSPLVATWYVGQ